jgi:hypothetical protein
VGAQLGENRKQMPPVYREAVANPILPHHAGDQLAAVNLGHLMNPPSDCAPDEPNRPLAVNRAASHQAGSGALALPEAYAVNPCTFHALPKSARNVHTPMTRSIDRSHQACQL